MPDESPTMMAPALVTTLVEYLSYIHSAAGIEITSLVFNVIRQSKLPLAYLDQLCEDRITACRACLLAWAVTDGAQIP